MNITSSNDFHALKNEFHRYSFEDCVRKYKEEEQNIRRTRQAIFPGEDVMELMDETDLGSEMHADYIKQTLSLFGKSLENVIFVVGDNATVNQKLARILEKPLIGYASHRFNLAVSKVLQPQEPILKKVNELMKKLSSLKKAAPNIFFVGTI